MQLISVKEFARRTGRAVTYVYLLIHEGNKYRKLRAVKVRGVYKIPVSEVDNFPFTEAGKIKNDLMERIVHLEDSLQRLEREVGQWSLKQNRTHTS